MIGIALLTVLHVVVAVFLIMVVLLQTGKRADLAGAFGGGGSQTAFGARGAATLLSKLTTASAVIFMLTSLALSLLATHGTSEHGGSVLPDEAPPAQTRQVPAPAPAPGSPPAEVPGAPDVGGAPAQPSEPPTSSPDSAPAPSKPN